jgi:AAA ATPase domain
MRHPRCEAVSGRVRCAEPLMILIPPASRITMRLQNLTIERFKRLERIDFNFNGVNILIGGNNSGKSTIIQAVHFAFTLLQSLNIANKWPVTAKKSSTISPTELIYIPSEDPYSLGYGGRLTEDKEKPIVISLTFDD